MNDATSAKEEIVTTESEMPDPVDMLRKTTLRVHEIMAGIRQEQGDAATPCTEWNVRQVMNHVIGGAEVLAGSLEGYYARRHRRRFCQQLLLRRNGHCQARPSLRR